MNQIPDAFNGHALTGWVYTRGYAGNKAFDHVSRLAADGSVVTVYGDLSWVIVACTGQQIEGDEPEIKTPRDLDPVVEKHCGGWAPAPIGYSADPGWQPIETAPKDGAWFLAAEKYEREPLVVRWSTNRRSRLGYSIDPGFVGDTRNVTIHGDASIDCDIDEQYIAHWRPLPSPPESGS